jgi:hypothetical protein
MATSEARARASRENGLKSKGPITVYGKMISRQNALKFGMTGEGIALPDEVQDEVDRRFAALEAELAPSSEVESILVRQAALHSIRMERCAREDAARLGEKMRNAATEFDHRRLAEVQKLFDRLADDPAANSLRLRRTPEGVDRLIRAWDDLARELESLDLGRCTYHQLHRLENLRGRRADDIPASRDNALWMALFGQTYALEPGEAEGLDEQALRDWARGQLLERIAAAIAELRAFRDTFDPDVIAQDRAEAATRAILDTSKEGILARRYENAAERGFYKALNELRERQAQARAAEADSTEPDEAPPDDLPDEALGSFFPADFDDLPRTPRRAEPREKRGSKTPGKGRRRPS